MERLKLKDYVKRGTNVHPKHKRDLIYLIIPLLIVSLVGCVAVILGILKLTKIME